MRFIFLIPDLYPKPFVTRLNRAVNFTRLSRLKDFVRLRIMPDYWVHGGTLNIMRHCAVARSCGADAVLATIRGQDVYGEKFGLYQLPFMRWADRTPDDVCIIPDIWTDWIDEVKGPAIAYLQVPLHVRANFDYMDSRVSLWTDSPFMQEVCRAAYAGKETEIVPNVVDNTLFPYIPQAERQPGVLFAFPRKGREFITATQACYKAAGGTYWQFELIDGLTIHELATEFRRPQAFLASADMEGCALPPQESMASGIVVVGKTAKGANFCMEHRRTAMIAETPEESAQCLIEIEDMMLRDTIARNAYEYISQYFPDQEPYRFWQDVMARYSSSKTTPQSAMAVPSA